ncbi:MAG: DNA replication/repair protein RecF [Gammaproteobacteria bacterium]|nr:DNA replication/repair protein RecF [Gammaproteobacteria bacterium]
MQFEAIDVSNVRSFSKAQLLAEPGLNLVYGRNGSGKTSLLEAINLLSRARSFRTGKLNDVIRHGEDRLQVTANVVTDEHQRIVSGFERKARETRIRFGGVDIFQVSEQVRNLPVLVLTPESQGLLSGTPKERRRWLDWTMFHVEPGYLQAWSDYQKSLRHRNQLIRNHAGENEFVPWEHRLSDTAARIQALCAETVHSLQAGLQAELPFVLEGEVETRYCPGWCQDEPLEQALAKSRPSDINTGYTRCGPHRADVDFRFQGESAAKVLSRGQAKLYMVALLLAQSGLIREKTGKNPVVLIDDVFAELDSGARERLSKRLADMNIQCFITSTDSDMQEYCSARFHVEQGCIEKQN